MSQWGPGVPQNIDYRYPIFSFGNAGSFSKRWEGSGSLETPDVGEIPGIEIFEGGGHVSFDAHWDLEFKLIAELKLAVGSVTVDYQINLDEAVSDVANTLNAPSYIDTAAWSVASASINSTGTDPSDSSAELFIDARVGGGLSGSIGAYA